MNLTELLAGLKRVRRSGNGYVALCPAHHDRHHSFSITQSHDRILLHCFADCSAEMICEALGIRVRDLFGATSSSNAKWMDEQRLKYARRSWEASKPVTNTAVEDYLRNRGITSAIPRSIRFVTVTCDEYPGAMHWPALCAGIQDVNSKFVGVAITALCADGSQKAPFDGDERRIYGPYRGGAVRLTSELDTQLAIGEGIETMLSVQQATRIPSWAALTATNLAHVQLPDSVDEVIVCADADATGERAVEDAARRFVREGRRARIACPAFGKDFNDMTF